MIQALLIIICGLADHLRGGWRPWPWTKYLEYPAKFGYGMVLGALLGLPWWAAVLCGPLWWLGEKPGWGQPAGWSVTGTRVGDPEWWQVGILADNPWIALAARGAMWAAPCLLLAYWCPAVLWLLSAAVAMPAGQFIERRIYGNAPYPRLFNGEFWRGIVLGLLCAVL